MPSLSTKPGSITPMQTTTLVLAGKRLGFDLSEIRAAVGGSIRKLSAADASEWIKRYTGRDLPNPPGQAPRSAYRKRKTGGATKIISAAQIDQIGRLAVDYFAGSEDPGSAAVDWLKKNFKVESARELGTAERAGQVIAVLKEMLARQRRRP